MTELPTPMRTPIDSMRLIHWASGAPMPTTLPIKDPTPDPGLLGPDSISWKLHEEQWLITAGARAFLMQAAHPKVAQGALDHSGFAQDPFGRVSRTIESMAVLIFGTTREANDMARHINRLHRTVVGTLHETIGHYHDGEPYNAMEPPALLWVHIVFVDSMLTAYKTFVGPLSTEQCDRYWQESCRYARLLGLTDEMLPATYAEVQQYIRNALPSGEIAIGPAARFISKTILFPPTPLLHKPSWAIVRTITFGQLPPDIRKAYGLSWGLLRRTGFQLARVAGHLLRWLFPRALGTSPLVDFARRRTRGELASTSQNTYTLSQELQRNTRSNHHDRRNRTGTG
jgi:uncharacterized protein (DUF2236 family)